jgi:small-conductance mechanosensitive channel
VRIDSLKVDGRDAVLRLRRVKTSASDAVWLVAPQFVDDVEPLYEKYGPNEYEKLIPDELRGYAWGSVHYWELVALPVLLLLALLVGWAVRTTLSRGLGRVDIGWVTTIERTVRRPATLFFSAVCFHILGFAVLRLGGAIGQVLRPLSLFLVILSVAWLVMRGVSDFADSLRRRYSDDLPDEDAVEARRRMTHISVASRLLVIVVVMAAVGIALEELDVLQTLGMALLGSAGAMGILLGIAGHRVLGNVLAGMQIALTKPVRIGDCVVYDEHYGWVENISYTYLTIRTFSHQRLIVPFSRFLDTPILNKSHTDPKLNEPIYLHVDARADIDVLRVSYLEMVEGLQGWSEHEEPKVEVVDVDGDDMKVRFRCTASDPSTAWDMHCQLREKLMKFLQQWEDGRYLPRHRMELAGDWLVAPRARLDEAAE